MVCALGAERGRLHVAGQDAGLVRQRVQQLAMELSISVWWSEPGRSVRPTEPWKSTSPEKIAFSAGIEYVTWSGLWPGVPITSISKPASVQLVAVLDRLLGRVGLERPEAREAHVLVDVLEDEDFVLGAVDGRVGAPRHLRDRADVVEVTVGDQDRLDRGVRALRAPP